jgi:hypothetical protein
MITEMSMKKDRKKSFPIKVFGSDGCLETFTLPQLSDVIVGVIEIEMKDRLFGSDVSFGTVTPPQLNRYIRGMIESDMKGSGFGSDRSLVKVTLPQLNHDLYRVVSERKN